MAGGLRARAAPRALSILTEGASFGGSLDDSVRRAGRRAADPAQGLRRRPYQVAEPWPRARTRSC